VRHVIIDTDIGTDVDDLLALVFIAKAPELCLEGITTVHGDTLLRAKIARIACQRIGIPELPIAPGTSETLSGHQISWAGHEGDGISGLDRAPVDRNDSAQQFLLDQSEKYSGELEILAIGPLTNLAKAVICCPDFKSHVKRLYLMGGAYWLDYSEHNIETDVLAAKIVFESGMLITAIGLDVTLRVWLTEREVEQLRHLPNGLGPLLEGQIRRWWKYLGRNQNNPHDPLAALAMVRPDLFLFERCDVAICTEHNRLGHLVRHDNPAGKIDAAYELNIESAQNLMLSYITR
jgi:purine nucleosidase